MDRLGRPWVAVRLGRPGDETVGSRAGRLGCGAAPAWLPWARALVLVPQGGGCSSRPHMGFPVSGNWRESMPDNALPFS